MSALETYQAEAHKTAVPYMTGVDRLVQKAEWIGDGDETTLSKLLRLSYVTMGLAGEAGELSNKVKKVIRDGGGVVSVNMKSDLMAEMGDVLWYLAEMATVLDTDLGAVAALNLGKLQGRAAAGTLGGSGDKR